MSATEGSPKWKNPSDVMKVRNIKRRTLARRKTIHDPTELSSALLNSRSSCHRPVNKRKNPFGCTSDQNKRPNHGNNIKEDPKEFFKALDVMNERENGASICQGDSIPSPHATSDVGDGVSLANFQDEQKWQTSEGTLRGCAVKLTSVHTVHRNEKPHDTELLVADQPTLKTPHPRVQLHERLPLDWSLKVKMRIVSEASLAWCNQLKMSEEARAVSQHVQGRQQWHSDADRTSAFHSCCLYWVHPNIPWIKPFPRIVAEQKISNVSIVGSNDEATLALHRDWAESFTSVFHLLRAGKCPYFYLCTHQFTVLFRAMGVNSQTNINACLTPTTRGLREAFKQDGISFRMPNLEGKKLELSPETISTDKSDQNTNPAATSESDHTPSPHGTACTYHDEDDDDLIDNDEGASVWLESMGLDKKSFPSLDPKKVKLQREGFRRVDNRPESLVYVEGADVQAMFNFLLNCRSCTATSGPQAGVPPTILAPTPFKGATLKPNKLKHSVAKQTDASGNIQKGHVIEMSGPILPHHVLNISHLLRDLQEEDFTLTFNTHEPTASLNLRGTLFQSDSCKEVEASGLHPKAQETLSSLLNLRDNTVYKEVTSTRHGFSFNL